MNYMRQCKISESLEGLDQDLMRKYDMTERNDLDEWCGFFGMYREEDLEALKEHRGDRFIIWFGSDAKDLPDEWVYYLKWELNIAISRQVLESLRKKGLDAYYLPINATIAEEWPATAKGEKIYWYYNEGCKEFYGSELIEQIEERIDIPIIKADYQTFTKDQLYDVYAQCFLNLRLTPHDGCPNTNLQMGLMGRKSIYNGDLPHSIAWTDVDNICESIMREYDNRHLSDNVSSDFVNFVKILTI